MADRTALAWAIAIALGLAFCAIGCEGPGLEPPYMSGSAGSNSAPDAGTLPRAGAGGQGAGSAGKGGAGGAAGRPQTGGDAGTPTSGSGGSSAEMDGGSDEDAGTR